MLPLRTRSGRLPRPSPIVGITADLAPVGPSLRAMAAIAYARAVAAAGGTPVILPPVPALAADHVRLCDALVFTGGDDPRMERWGVATHPKARPIHPDRQEYEVALLDLLLRHPALPVLGVCLGMQLMALHAGGMIDQHLPDSCPTADLHKDGIHGVTAAPPLPPSGRVASHHRQAVCDPGRLTVLSRAEDGIIEAIADPSRAFYIGIQWHPERTDDPALGADLFRRLVDAASHREL